MNFLKNKFFICLLIFSITFCFVPTQPARADLGSVGSFLTGGATALISASVDVLSATLSLVVPLLGAIGDPGIMTTGLILCATGIICGSDSSGSVTLMPSVTGTTVDQSCHYKIPVKFYNPRMNESYMKVIDWATLSDEGNASDESPYFVSVPGPYYSDAGCSSLAPAAWNGNWYRYARYTGSYCSGFGLFSGCSGGGVANNSCIQVSAKNSYAAPDPSVVDTDRQVAIYRYELPADSSQAVLNDWFINQIPRSAGEGWMDVPTLSQGVDSDGYPTGNWFVYDWMYNYKSGTESAYLTTMPYSKFCSGNVCSFNDETAPDNSYVAYVAKIVGDYTYPIGTSTVVEIYSGTIVAGYPNKFLSNADTTSAYFPLYIGPDGRQTPSLGTAIVGPYKTETPVCPVPPASLQVSPASISLNVFTGSNMVPAGATVAMLGDVSGDMKVTAADPILIQQYVKGLKTLIPNQMAAADVNNDGKITMNDATILLQLSARLYSSIPVNVKVGDINGDGKVDASDAVKIMGYLAGNITLTAPQTAAADVNNDGQITQADSSIIMRYIVHIISALPLPYLSTASISVGNNGTSVATLNWSAASDKSWLSITPASDSSGIVAGSSKNATLIADTTLLSPGTYTGNITITGTSQPDGTVLSPQVVAVTLKVTSTVAEVIFADRISASPNPCEIKVNESTCDTNLTWKKHSNLYLNDSLEGILRGRMFAEPNGTELVTVKGPFTTFSLKNSSDSTIVVSTEVGTTCASPSTWRSPGLCSTANASTSCDLPVEMGGGTLGNGLSITASTATTAVNCNSISISRTCVNGTLGGDESYKYNCTNTPAHIDGACSAQMTHYKCGDNSDGINQVSSPSKWTWTCNGSGGGEPASCSQNKTPGYIEG